LRKAQEDRFEGARRGNLSKAACAKPRMRQRGKNYALTDREPGPDKEVLGVKEGRKLLMRLSHR